MAQRISHSDLGVAKVAATAAGPRPGLGRAGAGAAQHSGLAPDLIRRQNWGPMPNAVIIDAVRTPVGRRGGRLSGWHATDLAAQPLAALLARNDLDPALVEDVVMGCTMTVGEQAMNIARNAALAAGFPESVPGTTVDRQCGSAQQAIHFAAQAVMAGAMDVAIGGGVESMSRVPIGSTTEPGPGEAYGPLYLQRFELIHQGECAQEIARRWKIGRAEMDEFSLRSHQRAARATDEGRFANEIVPLEARVHPDVPGAGDVSGLLEWDEGVRRDTSLEKLAALRPAFSEDGTVTAGSSSQISDGAAAVLIMSEERATSLGLRPRARFHTFAVAANDPQIMLTAPIPATELVLSKAKLSLDDIDLVEINEAFASVVLAWEREYRPDMERVNVNGGAIAIGHPTGCSGARLMATLLNELERTGGRYGLQTMCEGGGQANATIIERLG
jgi:acetyl-CoA acetyltransferase family protein